MFCIKIILSKIRQFDYLYGAENASRLTIAVSIIFTTGLFKMSSAHLK